MALDSRQKRAAVIGVARAWYRNPHPSSVDAAQRAGIGQVYPVAVFQGIAAPVFSGTISDIELTEGTGTTDYDLSLYFSNADSYSIAPPVEAGWTFNTTTGVLTVLPDTVGNFGPYVVTGTNAGGTADSNSFGIAVTEVITSLPGGSSDPARKYLSAKDVERLRKAYAKAKGIPQKEEEKPKKTLTTTHTTTHNVEIEQAAPVPEREFTALKPQEVLAPPVIAQIIAPEVDREEINREITALETHIAQHKQWDEEEILLLLMVG